MSLRPTRIGSGNAGVVRVVASTRERAATEAISVLARRASEVAAVGFRVAAYAGSS